MLKKYVDKLEDRAIYEKTGEVWTISDVPPLWRAKVEAKVIADGYVIELDGTVSKVDTIEE